MTDDEKKKKINDIIEKTKEIATDAVNKFFTRCLQSGKCPNLKQFDTFMHGVVTRTVDLLAGNDFTAEEIKSINSKLHSFKNHLMDIYTSFASKVKITGTMPTDTTTDGSSSDSTKTISVPTESNGLNSVSEWYKTNVTFSGCDMVVTAECKADANHTIRVAMGTLQTLSYSLYRQAIPITAIGNANAKDYVMGLRTIAGSMVFTVFNEHWGSEFMEQFQKLKGYSSSRKFVMDEIQPLDITITMANEYGVTARIALYSVRLFSEGMVMSINDVFTENTYQYVALNIDYQASTNSLSDDSSSNSVQDTTDTTVPLKPPEDGGQSQETQPVPIEQEIVADSNSRIYEEYLSQFSNKTDYMRHITTIFTQQRTDLRKRFEDGNITKDQYEKLRTVIDNEYTAAEKIASETYKGGPEVK